MDPIVRVTRSGNRYIVRVGNSWELVPSRRDVAASVKVQLRWYDKLGGASLMASSSWDRNCTVNTYRCLQRGTCKASLKSTGS